MIKTADDIYIRFHGIKQWYRHDYSEAELAEWASQIRKSGATRVWPYFNNDRDCYAIKNACIFIRLFRNLNLPAFIFDRAFGGIQISPLHKTGVAVRLPSMNRWRDES